MSPLLAEMLRLWFPYAASAQPGAAAPHVIFKQEKQSYGTSYDGNAYQKMVARAWKVADVNPQEDAAKERQDNDRHGKGCDWARNVIGRARRGVVCQEGEQHDNCTGVQ